MSLMQTGTIRKMLLSGEYLSGANPFLFADIGSADPAVFTHFCEVVTDNITVANSYSLAQKYINDLNNESITKAFYSRRLRNTSTD